MQRINLRLVHAREYLRAVGWTRGSHGKHGEPTDLRGALYHCDMRDGTELIAARLIEAEGFDTPWNDLECQNLFEAMQALEHVYSYDELVYLYGRNYYGVIGLLKLLSMAKAGGHLEGLAAHIGPADAQCIAHAVEISDAHNPVFGDVAVIVGNADPSVRMLADALAASVILQPYIPPDLAEVLAPVIEKMGL